MTDKPAGWYYVGDGKLRYRDDYGWTEFYLATTDPLVHDWPPPKPRTMLQQVMEEQAQKDALAGRRRQRSLWGQLRRGR